MRRRTQEQVWRYRTTHGGVPQIAIERHVWGGPSNWEYVRASPSCAIRRPDRQARRSAGRNRTTTSQPMVTQGRVLSGLEFVLGKKERALQATHMIQDHAESDCRSSTSESFVLNIATGQLTLFKA